MKCSVCNKNISGQYFTDNKGKVFCSDACFKDTLPKCNSCGKRIEQWIESEKGEKYCCEKCYESSLPKCFICGQPMKQWTENDKGQKFCSDKCYQTTWYKCSVCGKPMDKWVVDREGDKYCSDVCFESKLPKCQACGNRMRQWIVVDNKNYCNTNCLSKTFKYYRLDDVERKMKKLGYDTLDVLVTGSTGVGKSTTLNALFEKTVAKVGHGVDPETMEVSSYIRGNHIQIWDTPGFGDGIEQDRKHAKKIIDLLNTRIAGDDRYAFIDMVVVLLEASLRDMGTAYQLINEVIIPNLRDGKRIIIGLNQADFAMKGMNFDYDKNKPNDELKKFLDEKVYSIKRRIKEATGLDNVGIIYYSAETGYNVLNLLDLIIDNIPMQKRNFI